jgi:geranylgeranyl reductase family protein
MIYDVAVIGAGPVGSMAALVTAKKGLRTVLIEEHEKIGAPSHCAGKLSVKAFNEFDLPSECILNSIRGAYFHSPENNKFRIKKNVVESYIINRELFDFKLAEKAQNFGATLLTGKKVCDATKLKENDSFLLKIRGKAAVSDEINAKFIIDAEGANASIPKKLGLSLKHCFLTGIQYEMSNIQFEELDCVEMYFGKHYAPGFFAWIIPVDEGKARVGLCVNRKVADFSAREYLDAFIQKHPVASNKLRGGKIERKMVGRIPIHGPIPTTFGWGILVVGDAAGQVKSTTGGGIYFGLKAAEIAGTVAAESIEVEDISSGRLSVYEERWKKVMGYDLRVTSSARRAVDKLSDKDLDDIFKLIAEDEKIKKIIEKYGDTAYQSKLMKPLTLRLASLALKKPSNLLLLSKLAVKGLLSMWI